MSTRLQPTISEIIFAATLAAVAAAFAGIAGFVGAGFVCANVLSGETGEFALVADPAAGFLLAATVFILCFRKIITYGDSS